MNFNPKSIKKLSIVGCKIFFEIAQKMEKLFSCTFDNGKIPLYSHIFTFITVLIFAFYCCFKKPFFEKKKYEIFSKPYIPKFLLFIEYLSKNCSTKTLKLSK